MRAASLSRAEGAVGAEVEGTGEEDEGTGEGVAEEKTGEDLSILGATGFLARGGGGIGPYGRFGSRDGSGLWA